MSEVKNLTKEWVENQFESFANKVDENFARKGSSGESGRSIESIRLDDENNVWIKYDDGSQEENVGQLKPNFDISADFLTVEGFGKLRYYQNRFQYNVDGEWIDTVVTPDNIFVVNMTPNPMQHIAGMYDNNSGYFKLKWTEPEDTIMDGQAMCIVESVVIRRKKDSAPTDIEDGDFVIELPRKLFGMYSRLWYRDESFKPNRNEVYYYKAFPTSATTNLYNNSIQNETSIRSADYELYGFEINQNESAPEYMITYIENNRDWFPAYMDYDNDEFNYGDWTPENVFFMNVRPCMLNRNGTVVYYLNPNNYAYKENGEDSKITNESYDYNAMMQFPKIYWKITDLGSGRAQVRITNKNFDGTYRCWSHIDENGNEIPYCYMPIYNGFNRQYTTSTYRLRSLSGKTPASSLTAQQEIDRATNNNQGNQHIWYTEVFSDRQIVNLLLLLIGKSTDTQTVFGNGYCFGGSENTGLIKTGTMDDKGLFYGKNTKTRDGVKVFGMEHWWGNQWRRIGGYICDRGMQKIKMTYGKSDGSDVDGYNTNGDGYIIVHNSTPDGISGGYISSVIFNEYGLIPKIASGTSATYYSDGLFFNNNIIAYASVSGASITELLGGIFWTNFIADSSHSAWNVGASISCKPLLSTQQNDPNVNTEAA